MSRTLLCSLGLAVLFGVSGCIGDEAAAIVPIPIAHELTMRWRSLPHRISELELTLVPVDGGALMIAQNDGGTFGVLDEPEAVYGLQVWRSDHLIALPGSVDLMIEPDSFVDGEPFSAQADVVLDIGVLASATTITAWIRGFHISTDRYESPPTFEADPVLPYDPADGYTTQGLGITLSEPSRSGEELRFVARVRNSLGLSDRGDMNAAIPLATTWVRIDYVLVGAIGRSYLSRSATSYQLSTADYGSDTIHPHATLQDQLVELHGHPQGGEQAIFGISSFDLWLNQEEHKDPTCQIVQDAINSWGEQISGPGRYMRELSVRLWDTAFDPVSANGSSRLDLMLSNSSEYKEVGNCCLGLYGEVSMLQFSDPAAGLLISDPEAVTFASGNKLQHQLNF